MIRLTLRSLAAFWGKETRVSQTATKRSGNAGNKTYPRELKNLGGKVLQHGSDVDSCLRADAHLILGVLLEEALHTAARELKDWGLATVRVWRNKRWRAGPPPPLPRCANSVPRGRQTRWTGQHSRSWADVGGANLGLRWLGTTPVLRNGSETRAGRVALQGIEKRHRCAGRRDGSAMLFRGGGKRERKTHQRPDIPANQRARNGSAASWGRQPRKSYRRSSCLPRTCPFRRPLLRHGLRGVIRLGRKKVVGVKKAAVKWPGAMHGLDVDDASTGSSQ